VDREGYCWGKTALGAQDSGHGLRAEWAGTAAGTRWRTRIVANTKKTGSFQGKSNALGYGGRAAQMKAQGVPGGVIGEMARAKQAAPGQKNYHGRKAKGK
jgi:hypothetical protein